MPYIPLEEVESSNIEAIGYHRQSQTLRIRFQGARVYDYPMVLEQEYQNLMAAESKGRFFNSRIKPMYGHRSVRKEALVEPCCEHPGPDPTCTKECFPCQEWCCPGPGPDAGQMAAAVRLGMKQGASLVAAVRSKLPACTCPDAALNCDNSCECPCHVSAVPPLPLTPEGEVDVTQIPDVTHLFDEGDEGEEGMSPPAIEIGPCRCCGESIEITEEDSVALCVACFNGKRGDTDEPCTSPHHLEGPSAPQSDSD